MTTPADQGSTEPIAEKITKKITEKITEKVEEEAMLPTTKRGARWHSWGILHLLGLGVLGLGLLSVDYWRDAVTQSLTPILGAPMVSSEAELDGIRATQQDIAESQATLHEQSVTLERWVSKREATLKQRGEELEGLRSTLKTLQVQIAEQGRTRDWAEQSAMSSENTLSGVYDSLKVLEARVGAVESAQQLLGTDVDAVQRLVVLDGSWRRLRALVVTGSGFALELQSFTAMLEESVRESLSDALVTLGAVAERGVPERWPWLVSSQHLLQRLTASETVPFVPVDADWLDKVWYEVRNLVKITALDDGRPVEPSFEEVQERLADLAIRFPGDSALQRLKQQGEKIVAAQHALEALEGWLERQWMQKGDA